MRLDAGAEATSHIDTNYYWSQRVRVHIPIITTPGVRFLCGDAETHMGPGEVWIFDTWRPHNVLNPSGHPTHSSRRGHGRQQRVLGDDAQRRHRMPPPSRTSPEADPQLVLESINFPVVMSPYEFDDDLDGLAQGGDEARTTPPARSRAIDAEVRQIQLDWRAAWAVHGEAIRRAGRIYDGLVRTLHSIAGKHLGAIKLANGQDLARLVQISLVPALHSPGSGQRQNEFRNSPRSRPGTRRRADNRGGPVDGSSVRAAQRSPRSPDR